jgi:nucleoside-diphosphate-sugar epimerase
MNYLVTGNSGIIGSGITKYLTSKNNNVIKLSRNSKDIKLDLNNFKTPQKHFSFDFAIICSGVTDEEITLNPIKAINRSTTELYKLIKWIQINNIKKIVYISTSRVYGDLNTNIDESNTTIPNSLYGQLHLVSEKIIKDNFENYLIVRPGAVYGPINSNFGRWNIVQYSFPRDLAKNNCIVINGHGKEKRNFINSLTIGELIYDSIKNNIIGTINAVGRHNLSIYEYAQLCVLTITEQLYSDNLEILINKENETYFDKFNFKTKHLLVNESSTLLEEHIISIYNLAKKNNG